jgi:probable HAF family extracellular repeat protein
VLAYYQLGSAGFLWTVGLDGSASTPIPLPDFSPRAINEWGMMAGQQISSGAAAIAWFEDGVFQVQALPGLYSSNRGCAMGINNFGEVVGMSTVTMHLLDAPKPFYWSAADGVISINPGAQSGVAHAINDLGEVVGWSLASRRYAFLWQNGVYQDLNTLNGASTADFKLATAEAINNAGQIVGRGELQQKVKKSIAITNNTYLLQPNP